MSSVVLKSISVVGNCPLIDFFGSEFCMPSMIMLLSLNLVFMSRSFRLMFCKVWCSLSWLYATWFTHSHGLRSVLSLVRCMYGSCPKVSVG